MNHVRITLRSAPNCIDLLLIGPEIRLLIGGICPKAKDSQDFPVVRNCACS